MHSTWRITDDSREVSFSEIVAGDFVLSIPLFQREYVWTEREFDKLKSDIAQVEQADEARFLGAVVAIQPSVSPGKALPYELVDGQQRLTSIYLIILAAVVRAAELNDVDQAASWAEGLLLLRDIRGQQYNTKLVPSSRDRASFRDIWRLALNSDGRLAQALARNPPNPPDAGTADERSASKLRNQYFRALTYVRGRGLDELRSLVEVLAHRLSFIFIVLKDPGGAPRIFESLNDRGVKTLVGNLVRNEVFSRVSHDPDYARRIFHADWEPLQEAIGENFETFLFSYGLLRNPKVKKSELFDFFRRDWSSLSKPEMIIARLREAAWLFRWMVEDVPHPATGPLGASDILMVNRRLSRLRRLGMPTSIYPFVMSALQALLAGGVPVSEAAKMFESIESFLVRRAFLGFEPTGLHAVFKGLWEELGGRHTNEAMQAALRRRKTVPWPDDEAFGKAVREGDLYSRTLCHYVITEFDGHLSGDVPRDIPEIEHIMPRTLSADWSMTTASHRHWLNTWANLVPISPGMNRGLGNQGYDEKRSRYLSASMYMTPRQVAERYPDWGEEALRHRADELVVWALQRWPS